MIFDEQIKEKGIRLELEKTKRLNKAFIDEKRLVYLKWNRENWFNKQNKHK